MRRDHMWHGVGLEPSSLSQQGPGACVLCSVYSRLAWTVVEVGGCTSMASPLIGALANIAIDIV